MSKLDVTIIKWKSEVEEETIRLIEKGMPPYEAKGRAVVVVSRRRKKNYEFTGKAV